MTFQERFNAKYEIVEPGGCWVWMAAVNALGYGVFYDQRIQRNILARRVSWTIHSGSISEGLCVLHTCDVPPCVNPAYLWVGTNADNTADMLRKGRAACGASNGNTKLTSEEVAQIRQIGRSMAQCKIGMMFGVSGAHIANIPNNKRRRTRMAL